MSHCPEKLTRKASELHDAGNTVVFVNENINPIGLIALADQVRTLARGTIQKLREFDIRKILYI